MSKFKEELIADGKLPNLYWVSTHNNFFYFNKKYNVWTWADERDKFKVKEETIGVFSTFKEAEKVFNNIELDEEEIRGKVIEDRISGEIQNETMWEITELKSRWHRDRKFTEETMKKAGYKFE